MMALTRPAANSRSLGELRYLLLEVVQVVRALVLNLIAFLAKVLILNKKTLVISKWFYDKFTSFRTAGLQQEVSLLKTHWKLISRIERVADNLLIVACFFLAYRLRDDVLELANLVGLSIPLEALPLGPIEGYFVLLGITLPLYNAVLTTLGAYRSMRFSSVRQILKISLLSSVVVFFSTGAVFFLLKMDPSRSLLGIFCAFCAVAHFLERVVVS